MFTAKQITEIHDEAYAANFPKVAKKALRRINSRIVYLAKTSTETSLIVNPEIYIDDPYWKDENFLRYLEKIILKFGYGTIIYRAGDGCLRLQISWKQKED